MKKLFSIFAASIIFLSCSGPQGPIGPQGPEGIPGLDGGLEYAKAFEVVADFTQANGYGFVEEYGFDVFPADVPLIYMIWDVLENGTEVWRPLPQSAYLSQGILTYNFDFTDTDVSIFMDGTVNDFGTLSEAYRIGQTFRVVVVPAEFLAGGRMDLTYEGVTKAFNIKESDFKKHPKATK
ncbi:hypothetical protein SAMN06298216_0256 [Spirosomataceae bacterium TFI 002]|nr:hypothetical protein SAMN06298216_0256 [Spirosomataceae bacterium TFI 002]